MPELDPARTAHESRCRFCNAQVLVPLVDTRLEYKPWRIVWRCRVCNNMATTKVEPEMVPALLRLQRAGGMAMSVREADYLRDESLERFNRKVQDFLL